MEVFLPAGAFLEAMDIREVGQTALQLIILLLQLLRLQAQCRNLDWLKKGESSNIKHRVRQDQMCNFERPSPGCTWEC